MTATATATATDIYAIKFRRVLEYIDAHPDGDLSVDRLSKIAASSKYHFHRQFSGFFGIAVHQYVRLVRLRRASHQLAFRGWSRIIDIALANGYESHEAFSRAFKKAVGQTPSEFRERPRWDPWHAHDLRLNGPRSLHMPPEYRAEDVKIVHFEETRVAAFEHRGDPSLIGDSVRKFIEWRRQNNLPPKSSATFNILYNNPAEVPPEDYRLDICAATDRALAEDPPNIVAKTIPAGRCAILRHVGPDHTLGEALGYLYAAWLPASGEELRDFPPYLQRIRFFPDVPEREAVLDIFLPLR